MAEKTPVRVNYDGNGNAIGFAEFQAEDFIGIDDGGTGATTILGAQSALGLEIGVDIQAYDTDLATIAGLSHTDGNFIVSNGSAWVVESGSTVRDSLGLGTSDSPTFNNLTVGNDLTVTGDLTVQGDTVTINTSTVTIEDVLMKLGEGNTLDTVDLGWYGEYQESSTTKYLGFTWDASQDKFILWTGNETEPNTLVDTGDSGHTTATLVANIEGTVQGQVSDIANHTTDDLTEGSTNLYYASSLFDTDFATKGIEDLNDVSFTGLASGDVLRYDGAGWINDPLNLGTDTEGDYVADVTAGDGLAKTSTNSEGQVVDLSVNVDDSSIEIATDALQVKALGITNAMLAGSIENAKLTNSDITFTDGTTSTVASLGDTITFTGGTGVTIANTAGNFDVSFDLSEVSAEVTEAAQDAIDALLTAGTQTLISVNYNDNSNSLSYTVNNDLSLYSNANSLFITLTDLSGSTGIDYDNTTGAISIDSTVVTLDGTQTLTNKTFDANGTGNSISNIEVADFAAGVLDTDLATVSANDDTLASAKAIKDYVDSLDRDDDLDVTIGATTYTLDLDTEDLLFASSGNQLTVAHAEDVSGNITVTYTLDDDLSTYDNTTSAFITLTSLSAPNADGVSYDNATGEITLSSIPNASLANDSITINSYTTALGGTVTLVTDDIAEDGSPTNLWFTTGRVDNHLSGGTGISYTTGAIAIDFSEFDTDSITEGATNLFYADSLVDNHLSGGTGVTYTNGVISIGQDVDTTADVQFNSVQVDGTLTSDDITSTNISIAGNATITGNLTVQGTTTTIDSNTVNIGDNTLVLNADETGTPSQDAGIEIERGTSTNVSFIWDESAGKWTVDELGSHTIVASTFEGSLTGNASTATALASAQNFSLTGDVTATAISFDGTGAVALSTTIASGAVEFAMIDGAAVITSAEGIVANNTDDTSFPTTKAVYDYVNAIDVDDDLGIAGDTGTGTIDLDTQSLTLTGGTGITTTAANQAITVDIDSTVVTLDGTQTLSNKTLEATTIAGHLIPDTDVTYDLGSSTFKFRDLYLSGTSIYLDTNTITLNSGNYEFSDGSNIITMPIASTDTLVARNTSDTLSNKTVIDTDNVMVKTIVVDVQNGKYRFNGVSEAVLNLEANITYRFDLSHTSLATDEFALSETEDGENTITNTTDTGQDFDGEGIDEFFQFTIVGHGYSTGDLVYYDANGLFEIGGLTDGDPYYIIAIDSDTLQLAASASDASAGTEIELVNSAQAGNHTLITRTYTYGSEYTTGVTSSGTQGQAGAYKDLRVHTTTPTLYPYSKDNSNRGGQGKGRPESAGRFVGVDTDDILINKTIDLELNTVKITYAVTVAQDSEGNNKFYIDGQETASLALVSGFTYIFDLSDSSTASHPFALNDGKDGIGTDLTTGVTVVGTQGQAGAYYQIAVNSSTPDLVYYYCSVHSGMGGNSVLTVAGADLSSQTTDDLTQGSVNLYYSDTYVDNHLQGGTGIDYNAGVISVDDGIITSQSVKSSPVGTDQVLIYDVSGTSLKRITINDIVSQAGAGSMSSFTLSDGSLTTPVTDGDTVTINGTTNEIEVSVGTDSVTIGLPDEIYADLHGATHTIGKNESGGTLAVGTPVYISGQSGQGTEFTVDVADADGSGTMPAIGIITAASNNNSEADIITYGKFIGLNTSSFSVGDELYVGTGGTLVNTPPTGENASLQKIAKVIRVHASDGEIYVMGAGRSNAVPNLNDGNIFIGNASNQAVTASLDTKISDYLGAGGDITIGGNLIVQGTTTTIDSTSINVQNAFVFEGTTDDNFETTLTVVDPTADRTITLPDETGTVALNSSTLITGQSGLVGSLDTTNDLVLLYDDSSTSLVKIDVATLLAAAGSGSFNDFTIQADTGTPEVVADGNTVTFTGGTGIDTSVSSTDTINIAIDSTVLTTSSSINDLSDVNASSPQNEQVLQYNSTSGKYEPAYVTGGGGGGTADAIEIQNFLGVKKYIPVSNSEIPFIEYDGSNDNSDPLPITGSVLDFQETTDGITFVDDDIQLAVQEDTFSVIVDTAGTTAVSTEETANEVSFFTGGAKRAFVDNLGYAVGEAGMGFRNNDRYDENSTIQSGDNMMMVGPVTFSGTITVEGRLVVV